MRHEQVQQHALGRLRVRRHGVRVHGGNDDTGVSHARRVSAVTTDDAILKEIPRWANRRGAGPTNEEKKSAIHVRVDRDVTHKVRLLPLIGSPVW